jgi:hypothetical protein
MPHVSRVFAQDPLPCLPSEMMMPPEGSGMKELGVRKRQVQREEAKEERFLGSRSQSLVIFLVRAAIGWEAIWEAVLKHKHS